MWFTGSSLTAAARPSLQQFPESETEMAEGSAGSEESAGSEAEESAPGSAAVSSATQ